MPRPLTIAVIGPRFLQLAVALCVSIGAMQWAPSVGELTAEERAADDVRPLAPAAVDFVRDVQPLLAKHCGRCHNATLRKGELDLSSASGISQGSESGAVIRGGQPSESPLLRLVESGEMPPEDDKRLPKEDVELLRRWIEQGAKMPTAAPQATASLHQHDILPILLLRCATCHGRQRQEGGLDVRSLASLLKGGKSGPAIVPGQPDASLLVRRIHAGEMPPKKQLASASVKPVESGELEKLRQWIAQGAREIDLRPDMPRGEPDPLVSDADRDFWSFRSPRWPQIPAGSAPATSVASSATLASPPRNEVDAFVSERLKMVQLGLAPQADRRTLLRRLSLDLCGLPPAPEWVDEFAEDEAPDAYERWVDRLLASPRHGERWAQFWLDLAGYSDSEGVQDSDLPRPFAYRYRDYVIRSLNSDKGYDRFLLEQLAGDELADYEHAETITTELADNLAATAMLGMTADGTFAGITGFVPDRLDVVDDQLKIVGGGIMGLTIGCARCHSHKFDPIPQRDYYRLAAIFKGALDEHDWLKPTRQGGPPGTSDRYLPYVPTEERREWERHTADVNRRVEELKTRLNVVAADETAKKELEKQIKSLEVQRRPEPLVRAVWDRGEPSPTYVLVRGDYRTPGRLVGPGMPAVLSDGRTPLTATPPWPGAKKTGLRLAFAQWLTSPGHPLTARVHANRLWKLHFGEGIVRTLDNFGRAGDPPSHPQLLDWLALKLERDGWSNKSLHRVLVTSSTYRQSSVTTDTQLERDPDNRLLSRFPLQRLEAESLYDCLLALADQLDVRPYGPPDLITARPDGLVVPAGSRAAYRRAIYLTHRRTQPVTLLADFDRPAMSPNCVSRFPSTVAPQALQLLNSELVRSLADALAERATQDVNAGRTSEGKAMVGVNSDAAAAWIDRVHRLAFARSPTAEQRAVGEKALNALRARWLSELAVKEPKNVPAQAPGDSGDTTQVSEQLSVEVERRARASYAHAVLNSAELLFVD